MNQQGRAAVATRGFAREGTSRGVKVKVKIVGMRAQASRLEALRKEGAKVRTRNSPRRCCIVDDRVAIVRFTGPDSAIVVRDSTFVASKISEFDEEFRKGDELGGREIAR